MKIKVEGVFSDLATERAECEISGEPLSKETKAMLDKLRPEKSQNDEKNSSNVNNKNIIKPDLKQRFHDYVNHSRSPYSIFNDGMFTGPSKVLANFKQSFEKKVPGAKVFIEEKYVEGEYIPYVRAVTYKKGGDTQ